MNNIPLNDETIRLLPKYYQVKQVLLNEIKEGKYLPNTKLPSSEELTKIYKIGRETAKRVRLELINDGIAYAIQGKGFFVSDFPEKQSDVSKSVNNRRIAFLYPGSSSFFQQYYHDLLMGILKIYQPRDYKVEIYYAEFDYNREKQLLSRFIKDPPEGLVFIPYSYSKNYRHIFQLQKQNIPVVLIESRIKNLEFDWVGLDHNRITKKTIKYLIKLGHKRIVFTGYNKDTSFIFDMYNGYRQALKEKGIKFDPELVLGFRNYTKDANMHLKEIISEGKKFDAIFAVDNNGINTYKILKKEGIRVPEDVSLIAYIDSNEIADNFEVPLTTIYHDAIKLGSSAGELLLKKINNKNTGFGNVGKKEEIFGEARLMIRDSVKDRRSKKKK